jgi:hypothetical protein
MVVLSALPSQLLGVGGLLSDFNSLHGPLLSLGLIPLVLYRAGIGKAMPVEVFGDEYRENVRRIKKSIPFVY